MFIWKLLKRKHSGWQQKIWQSQIYKCRCRAALFCKNGDESMKIITVCGSLRFKQEIIEITEKMDLQGNCMLSIVYPARQDIDDYTDEEIAMLNKMHKERIKLSDAILVVNVDNYIGSSTKSEIEFAKELNKEIIYYTDII